jgi:DNA polymerase-3 subunit gamma/tau
MRLSTHARTLAEVAIVRICSLENLEDLSTLVAAVRSGAVSAAPSAAPRITPPVRPPAAYNASGDGGQKKNLSEAGASGHAPAHESNGERSYESAAPSDAPQPDAEAPVVATAAQPIELTSDNVAALWQQALDGLSNMASDQAGLADSVVLAGPRRVVVRFPRKYQSCKLYCERPEQAAMLQRRLMEVVGPPVQLEFVVDESIVEAAPTQRAAPPRPRTAERAQQPFVKKAMELFGATSIRVEEPPG